MRILIVGGDKRQEYLYDYFCQNQIFCDFLDDDNNKDLIKNIKQYSVVFLPVPLTTDKENIYCKSGKLNIKVNDFFDELSNVNIVFSGNINSEFTETLNKKSVKFFDLLKDESFVKYNAYLTAQGALGLLINNTQSFLCEKNVLVTGFGKVSKALCESLYDNKMNVYVCARKKGDLLLAETLGYKAFDFCDLNSLIHHFDYIFSTVPSQIIDDGAVKRIKKDAVYFELASLPYGAKKEDFKKYSKKYILANALPGKYCAKSWAETTAQYCLNLL